MKLRTQLAHSASVFSFLFCTISITLFTLFPQQIKAQTVQQVVIGATSGVGNWAFGPLYRNTGNSGVLNYSRHAYIYTATELGIPSGAKIIRVEWMKKDTGKVTGNNAFNVWMINTSSTSFGSSVQWSSLIAGATQVFASTTFAVNGNGNTYVSAPFVDSFEYNGGGLQIMTDWTKSGYATAAVPFYVNTAAGKGIGIVSSIPFLSSAFLQSSIYGNSRPTIRITYVTVPACSGTPNPGNTISSVSTICTGVPFTLSLQNSTIGSQVTYLWQSSDNSAFTSGVTSVGTTSTLTLTQTSNKYYRCIVTCGVGPTTGISSPVFIQMSPSYGCYCPSTAQSAADEDIFKFVFGSLTNCSNCTTLAGGQYSVPNLYSNYQYLPAPIVQIGSAVPFVIEVGLCGTSSYPNRCAIFIDYNHNTSFTDPGEMVYSSSSPTSGAHIESGVITIPPNALTGITGMRVINTEQGAPFTDPCLIYPWGETEDYIVNIQSATTCSGAPTPGNTIINLSGSCTPASGTYDLCSGNSVTLSLQNLTSGLGVTYQWYNNGIAIIGANSVVYTTPALTTPQTYYCNVTCTNSGITTSSTPMNITMASYLNCYCVSGAAGNTDEDILAVTLNGATNISDCTTPAPGPGSVLNQYSNFTTLGNLTAVTLGNSFQFSIYVDDCDIPPAPYYSFATSIWIDFNHNGSFNDAGEQVFIEPIAGPTPRTVAGTISIPCTALSGQTRIRISVVEGLSGPNITSCLVYGFGETEDYLINLLQPTTACSLPIPAPGATIATQTFLCDSAIVVLSLSNSCLLGNYNYQWYKNSVAIAGATSYTYTTPKMFANASYYCVVSCGSSTATSTPVNITKSTITPVSLTASASTYCSPGGLPVVLTASSTSALTYTYNPNTSLTPTTGSVVSAAPVSTTTYTVTGTDASGCTRTSATNIQVIACSQVLNLKVYIQGYYVGGGQMTPALSNEGVGSNTSLTDSIDVELHASTSPYSLVATKRVALSTNGSAIATFPTLSGSYYVAVKHRNAIETWSAAPIAATVTSYDFTTAANKAYGSNQVLVDIGKWGLYSGDLNADDNIDLLDLNLLENDVSIFASGYVNTDLNGDGNTDLLDTPMLEDNITNFIFTLRP